VLGRPPSNAAPKAPIHCGKRCRQYFEGAQPSNRPSKVTGTSIRSYSSDIEQECLDRWGVEYTKWFFLKSQARSFSFSFSANIEFAKTKEIEPASHLPS
jgi:hypothetical protein